MESFFSSLKTGRTARKVYRSRDEAKADVFDHIERFYNGKRPLDDRLRQSYGIRDAGGIRLTACHPSGQRLSVSNHEGCVGRFYFRGTRLPCVPFS